MYAGDGSPHLDCRHDGRTDVKSRCAEQERGIGVFLCGTSRFCRSDEAESAVHSLLDQVLRHPSRSFHLTLVTRRAPLPLATLRAKGGMVEIREQDLRFTRDETRAAVLAMGGISVGDDTLTRLHAGLEGWIVGLRLVCLTLRNQADSEAFLARLHGGTPTRRLPPLRP